MARAVFGRRAEAGARQAGLLGRLGSHLGGVAVAIGLLTASLAAYASDRPGEIDFGALEGSVYRNAYFGLQVELPAEWTVLDQAAMRRLAEVGGALIAGEDENLKAIVKASELQTVNLLGAFEHPLGSPVPYNPSFMSSAERLEGAPGIQKGADYLFHAKRMLQSGQLEVSFPGEVSSVELGGQAFDVLPVELEVLNIVVRQRYYAAVMRGYALVFIASFTNDEQEATLDAVVESITFE